MTSPRRALMSPTRRRLLARVHLLAKQSGLEEDAYRDLLERETGRRSAAVLGEPALARVVDVLEALVPAITGGEKVRFHTLSRETGSRVVSLCRPRPGAMSTRMILLSRCCAEKRRNS